uniref:RNase H type-1 domain-containing protein n=1 Tax=Cajanus cajan TaxID=3821 RepID=A0A151RMM4_CAJCA|nr:hypothetical protein KK1_034794 [Cajanus cajan]
MSNLWDLSNLSSCSTCVTDRHKKYVTHIERLLICKISLELIARVSSLSTIYSFSCGLGSQSRFSISDLSSKQKWSYPPTSLIKINCDGVVSISGVASCRGVIRDESGNFVAGFSCQLGRCSVIQFE